MNRRKVFATVFPDGISVLLVANPMCERSEHVTFWLRARWREAPPSELRRGSGGAAPSGVQGRSPWWGARGAKPPGKILRKKGCFEQFWNISAMTFFKGKKLGQLFFSQFKHIKFCVQMEKITFYINGGKDGTTKNNKYNIKQMGRLISC